MNVDDYLYVYFAVVRKAIELYPTSDQKIVYDLSSNDKKFYAIVQKVGEMRMGHQLRQLFIELTDNGIIKGTIAKQSVLITAVTPLGYTLIKESGKQNFWRKLKKAAPKWAATSLTEFIIAYLTR